MFIIIPKKKEVINLQVFLKNSKLRKKQGKKLSKEMNLVTMIYLVIVIVIELKKIDFIGNIDLNNLACYCQAFSNYLKATKQLNKEELTVEKQTRDGVVIAENPLINIQRKYAEEMRKFGSLCGLSVDARLKIASLKVKEKENDISDEFGDI